MGDTARWFCDIYGVDVTGIVKLSTKITEVKSMLVVALLPKISA